MSSLLYASSPTEDRWNWYVVYKKLEQQDEEVSLLKETVKALRVEKEAHYSNEPILLEFNTRIKRLETVLEKLSQRLQSVEEGVCDVAETMRSCNVEDNSTKEERSNVNVLSLQMETCFEQVKGLKTEWDAQKKLLSVPTTTELTTLRHDYNVCLSEIMDSKSKMHLLENLIHSWKKKGETSQDVNSSFEKNMQLNLEEMRKCVTQELQQKEQSWNLKFNSAVEKMVKSLDRIRDLCDIRERETEKATESLQSMVQLTEEMEILKQKLLTVEEILKRDGENMNQRIDTLMDSLSHTVQEEERRNLLYQQATNQTLRELNESVERIKLDLNLFQS